MILEYCNKQKYLSVSSKGKHAYDREFKFYSNREKILRFHRQKKGTPLVQDNRHLALLSSFHLMVAYGGKM